MSSFMKTLKLWEGTRKTNFMSVPLLFIYQAGGTIAALPLADPRGGGDAAMCPKIRPALENIDLTGSKFSTKIVM